MTSTHDLPEALRPPVLNSIPETLRRLPISRAHFFRLVAEGEISTVKIGARTFVSDDEITDFIHRHTRRRER